MDQYCCTFHLDTLVFFFVLYNIIIAFTSGFAQHVVDTWWGGDMLSVWNDYENLIILNVGVLLSFFMWMDWVGCNVHFVTVGP